MNSISIVGKVLKASLDTMPNGKTVGKVKVDVRKKFGDKVFSTRFSVNVYGTEAAQAAQIPVGTMVWAIGEASAFINEYQGKAYANMQISGRVGVLVLEDQSQEQFQKHKSEWDKAPKTDSMSPQPRQQPRETQPTLPVEEDDVPF